VAAHARFHAAWWDHERLGVSVGAFSDQAGRLDRFVDALPNDLAVFADRLGDRLSAERRRIYERLITAAPRLLARYRSHRHLTLVHGDAHVWNALLPHDPGGTDVRLLDWDAWRVDTATDDLAYMLALHWYPDWRHRYEHDVLGRYHDVLVSNGVLDHALAPVIWWNNLERILLAVDDLGCCELLD
jgi:Ser/Thr protein kinase RdoA (MazF antagonist)